MHYFTMGVFMAFALSPYILITYIIAIVLILRWGNYYLPLMVALLLDMSLVPDRELINAYGFIFTISILVSTLILLKLRKFLKF